MLQIWLEACRCAGITEVLINVHAHIDAVRAAVGQGKEGLKINISEEPTLLGSAGTLLANRQWLNSDPYFWVFYADVLTNADLTPMIRLHEHHRPIATIGLYKVKDPSRCGVVSFDDQFVVREFVEKPSNPKSSWAFSGLMIGTHELLNAIPQKPLADLGFDVLPSLSGRMLACPINDYLLDIGTMENYEIAQKTWPESYGLPYKADQ